MTMIIRSAGEGVVGEGGVPKWMNIEATSVSDGDVERISSLPATPDEAAMTAELDLVEKSAATGRVHRFSAKWPADAAAQICEYAAVCGALPPVAVNPDDYAMSGEQQYVPEDPIAKVAATVQPRQTAPLSEAVGDPFARSGSDRRYDRKEGRWVGGEADDWQSTRASIHLDRDAAGGGTGAVTPVDGGYDYLAQKVGRVRPGENSVAIPDAIEQIAKSDENPGDTLHRRNEEHRESRKAARQAWQKEAVQAAKELGAGALPRGSVFITAAEHANPGGTSASRPSVWQGGPIETPALTEGEKVVQANRGRAVAKETARRDAKAQWERVAGPTRAEVSDLFADELEALLCGNK